MRTLNIILASALAVAACDSKKEGEGNDGKAEAKGPDYGPIDEKIKNAKSADEWTQITMDCASLMMDAAMQGQKLEEDEEFHKHCGRNLEFKRAEHVIANSTPDKMHTSCLTASMGLEELAKGDKEADKAKELLGKVNTACGME